MSQNQTATAIFSGPFRLISNTGEDLTPKSTLRQAILAVLISSPGQIRGRKLIQEMFWEGVDPDLASGRLRSALYQLRKDLATLGSDSLRADRRIISLAPNRIQMMLADDADQDILEGMDLPFQSADLFEEWLRDLRTGDAVEPLPSGPALIEAATQARPQISLGILDVQHAQASDDQIFRAGVFITDVAGSLAQLSSLAIYDLRHVAWVRRDLPDTRQPRATVFLKPSVRGPNDRALVTLQLLDAASGKTIWMSNSLDLNIEDAVRVSNFVADQILDAIARVEPSGNAPSLLPWATMSALFSLDPDTIIATEEQLSLICADPEQTIVKPLQVFAQIFRENEGLAKKQEIDPRWLVEALDTIDQSDPLRAISESLLGYSAHMLSSDNDLGSLLVEQAYLRAPQMALNLDHLAAIRLSQGDIDGAESALRACLKNTQLSPWRYSFEVTGAMISLARGGAMSESGVRAI